MLEMQRMLRTQSISLDLNRLFTTRGVVNKNILINDPSFKRFRRLPMTLIETRDPSELWFFPNLVNKEKELSLRSAH